MKKLEQPKKTAAKRHYSSLFKRQALERADKDAMKWAVIGLFLIFSSYAIVSFILSDILGIK